MKICKLCNEEKELTEFYSQNNYSRKKGKYIYYHPECKKCTIAKSSKWIKENPDRHLVSQLKSMKKPENRERRKIAGQKYRDDGYLNDWYYKNNEKIKIYANNGKTKIHTITDEELFECKDFFDWACAYCGMSEEDHRTKHKKKLHREHFIDDGPNDITNCVPACVSCNSSKGERDFYEWYTEHQEIYNEDRIIRIEEWLSKFK
jgi:5-methylcytosine-specific restriction endonuclease McrA